MNVWGTSEGVVSMNVGKNYIGLAKVLFREMQTRMYDMNEFLMNF